MDKNNFSAVGRNGVNNLKAPALPPDNLKAPALPPDVFGMNFFKRDKKGRWTHRL